MHKARKRFGQNFLHDQGVIDRIVACINPKEGEHLVEIGPGQGALTEGLLDSAKQLDAIELDRDLYPILRAKFFKYEGDFKIHEADALKFDFASLNKTPLRVAGNLPYNISSPLIFHLLEHANIITDMHFMLQKEVVERLAAVPNNSNYGRLSVVVQSRCKVEHLFNVSKHCFTPAPKVESAIVRLTPHPQPPYQINNADNFESLVKQAFGQRRKTLRNNLKTVLRTEQIKSCDIDPGARPETLSVEQFALLSNLL